MVLYDITFVPLVEEFQASEPVILTPFYADNILSDGLIQRSTSLIWLLLDQGMDWDTSNS